MKIHVGEVTLFGIFVIFAQQMYFFLHLRSLVRFTANDAKLGFLVPWIGAYTDWTSKLCTLFTIVILPSALCAFLVKQAYLLETSTFVSVLGFAVAFASLTVAARTAGQFITWWSIDINGAVMSWVSALVGALKAVYSWIAK